ncbi:toprim domain-containing protein [Halorhodospira sp. 9621]|uniref:toprim domain-containing protein n=1 Tax=Halorhodospira TaxID=85108 RepID=UPI001914801B|nr:MULTISPECIES: toprim domain-containing protein [Halorhodospira]MBK5943344.1 hypothetical protein [Halorhodospira halophila]MCG5526869.1 toprim domain-containing protein [Halorhodospira halophila]MCG5533130.1 toprim domain-containing protein [Halorhodospira sp. 9621]MCG5537885.1 toprim domain-containing protein [Halorhodospira sp. 9622]MCG5542794.1 toprim domain-containing protein [Halorhodospira sp. 9628]
MSDLRQRCRGQWERIISEILGPQWIESRKHQRCPCRPDDKPKYRFSDHHGSGSFFCHCSNGDRDGVQLVMCRLGLDFKAAAERIEQVIGAGPIPARRKPTRAERLQREVEHSGRSRYLESRGLEMAPGLRWHRSLAYYDEHQRVIGHYPAMCAPVLRDGAFETYHVTYLQGGQKLSGMEPRKILPSKSGSLAGASIPLYPPGPVLGVAEGIESAIAAKMLHGVPVWALINTALMKSWTPPAGTRSVRIYADHDHNYAGHAAAYGLAHRLVLTGFDVEVHFPPVPGTDWNDVLHARREVEAE